MQTNRINSLLSKLVTLTKERDDPSLQVALIKTLSDLINADNHESKRRVVIYHVSNAKKQTITILADNSDTSSVEVPADFKQVILRCLQSASPQIYQANTKHTIRLHPILGTMRHLDSVIAIDADHANHELHQAVDMVLEIYQNLISLNNENECDTLTGLLNRKTFDVKISKIVAQMHNGANRKEDKVDQKYFLAIFDIDHFKRVNDQFGHLIGDEVLLMFSQLMRQSFRDADPLFRFGGEEFVGFFECSNTVDIQSIFERFKHKIAHFEFPQVGNVTVSTGFTEISMYDTPTQIIDRADTALYYAKNHGRNRVDSYELLIANGSLQDNKKEGEIELF